MAPSMVSSSATPARIEPGGRASLRRSGRPTLTSRLGRLIRAHPARVAALVTFVLAWPALIAMHHSARAVVPKQVALEHVRRDAAATRILSAIKWTRYDVTAVDHRYEMLGFYRGPTLLATIGVGWSGRVVVLDRNDLSTQHYSFGSGIANEARVLLGLSVFFVLMTAVWPLRRLRNVDVLVAAGSALSIVLFNDLTLDRMANVSYALLGYFALRCAWTALGSPRSPLPSEPLLDHLTASWSTARRLRLMRLLAASAALVTAMVGLSSLHVVDVGYAVMEGATAIVHGQLPYGHIPDVLHGDTYPIGSYLLYVPFAGLSPVHSQWDDADFTLVVAVVAALAAAWGLSRLALRERRPHRGRRRSEAEEILALRGAAAWLTFPPLLVTASSGTTDVVLAALLVGALVWWRRPAISGGLLAGAVWFKLIPVVLAPLWLARLRGASLARAVTALLALSVAMVALLLGLGGPGALSAMVHAMSFQLTRQSPHTVWWLYGSVPVQQLVQALTLALILGAAVRLRRDRELANDRARFAALCGAVVLGCQISGNYWTFMYLVWAFPFLAASLLAPSGSGRVAR